MCQSGSQSHWSVQAQPRPGFREPNNSPTWPGPWQHNDLLHLGTPRRNLPGSHNFVCGTIALPPFLRGDADCCTEGSHGESSSTHFSVSDHRLMFATPYSIGIRRLARSSKFSIKISHGTVGLWVYADLRGHRGANGVHQLVFTSLHSKVIMSRCFTGPEVESGSTVAWPCLGSWLS
jgi:hypothetical protein